VPERRAFSSPSVTAAEVLPGLRDYYPELRPGDEIVIVRFEVSHRAG
jgi:hypothetical protein